MEKSSFRVSDHAVLRYMERAMGMNVEIVREHIAKLCRGPAGVGASCLRHDGFRFELANNTVVTVSPDDGNLSKTHKDRQQVEIQRRRDAFFQDLDARYAARDKRNPRQRAGREPIAVSIPDPGPAGFVGFPDFSVRAFEVLPGGQSGGPAADGQGVSGTPEAGG